MTARTLFASSLVSLALTFGACGQKEVPPIPATPPAPAAPAKAEPAPAAPAKAEPAPAKAAPVDAAPTKAAPEATRTANVEALEALIAGAGGDESLYAKLAGGKRGVLEIDEEVCEARIRLSGDIERFVCNDDLSQCAALQKDFSWTFVFETVDGTRRLLGVSYFDAAENPSWLTAEAIAAAKLYRNARCELVDAMLTKPESLVGPGVWTFDERAKGPADVVARCGNDAKDEILGWTGDASCLACDGLTCESAPGCTGRSSSWLEATRTSDGTLVITALGMLSLEKDETGVPDFVKKRVAEQPTCPAEP